MYKWILIFCLPLASFTEASLCSKSIANLTNMPKTTGFLQTLRAVFTRENKTPEQTPAAAAIQGNHPVQPLVDSMLAERPHKPGRPIFTKGLDEANRMIQLIERLRDSQIDPYTTHIPEFADDIPKHISFIKEGIEKSGEKKEAQLKALAEVEKEALEKSQNKQVTYEWWLQWNTLLTDLVSDFEAFHQYRINGIRYNHNYEPTFHTFFPEAILLPTIGDIGIIAMNRYFSHRILPLGVVNQPALVDGNLFHPGLFFDHDISHARTALLHLHISPSVIDKHFNINLYQEFKKLDLTPEQQEMIDLVYFAIWHEQSFNIQLVQNWREATKFEISLLLNKHSIVRFQTENDLRELLPVSVNADSKKAVKAYLNESKQLFEQLAHQIVASSTGTQ